MSTDTADPATEETSPATGDAADSDVRSGATPTDPVLAPARQDVLFGSAFVSAGVVVGLLTLLGAYLAERAAFGSEWLSANTIPLTQPNMMMAGLAMSVVTVQWAVSAMRNDDRGSAALALGITFILGAAFVNQSVFLFNVTGITRSQVEGPLFYAVTGAHVALVVLAMCMILLIAFRTLAGQYSRVNTSALSATAVFWDSLVAVYAAIWVAVYVMK